jgi:hypothetical protein
VEVGDRVGDLWLVSSGLNPDDRVITQGAAKVRDGSLVNPKPEAPGSTR